MNSEDMRLIYFAGGIAGTLSVSLLIAYVFDCMTGYSGKPKTDIQDPSERTRRGRPSELEK